MMTETSTQLISIDGAAFQALPPIVLTVDDVGFADLNHADGTPLTDAELKAAIAALENSLDAWRMWFQVRELELELQRLVTTATWVMPKNRREVYASGPCVYFICHPTRRFIKIGQTVNLAGRSRELDAKRNILFFAQSTEHVLFERILHRYFRGCRQGKTEWFEFAVVFEWLRGIAALKGLLS